MDLASTPTLELPAVVEPPERTADRQATLFRDLRFRIARNSLRTAWESGKVKLLSMLGTSLVVAAFVFGLSWYGIAELFAFKVPAKGLIVGGLFDLMFFTLGSMLLISTGIILYASLFTAPEARFLLCSPARADHVFASKFQGAAAFSSWAFLILGVPILVAYGIVAGVPWYFYPLIPLYLLGFVLVPGCLSAMAGLLFVRYAPRNRKQAVAVLILVAVSILTYWLVQFGMAARSTLLTPKKNEVEGLIGQFALVQHPAMPSHWMTNGLMAAARGELGNALTPLALLWSNGLMLYLGRRSWRSGSTARPTTASPAAARRSGSTSRACWTASWNGRSSTWTSPLGFWWSKISARSVATRLSGCCWPSSAACCCSVPPTFGNTTRMISA